MGPVTNIAIQKVEAAAAAAAVVEGGVKRKRDASTVQYEYHRRGVSHPPREVSPSGQSAEFSDHYISSCPIV